MKRLALAAVLGLSACATGEKPDLVVPASLCAEVAPEPSVSLPEDVLLKLDMVTVEVLGVEVAIPYIQARDVDRPAWGRRNAERLRQAQAELCN